MKIRVFDRVFPTAAAALLACAGLACAQEAGGTPTQPAQAPAGVAEQVPQGPQPNIEFTKLEHDFGSIYDTEPTSVEFTFKNTGDATLVINGKPQASCGCTVPDLPKSEYAPGETGTIKVTFNPQGKHGDQRQRVTVRSNDPDAPEVQLQIQAHVKSIVRIEPATAFFMEKLEGAAQSIPVVVTGETSGFEVTYASVSRPDLFSIRVVGTKPSENEKGEVFQQTELEVTMAADAPRGRHSATATVRTTDPRVPLVSFTVSGDVVGDLRVMPPRVNVGVNEPGQSFERLVRLSSRTNTPFTISDIQVKSNLPQQPEVTVTPVDPSQPGPHAAYELRIAGTSGEQTGPISGVVTLTTDSKSMPLLEVGFNGITRQKMPAPAGPGPGATPPAIGSPQGATPAPAPAPAQPKPAEKPAAPKR